MYPVFHPMSRVTCRRLEAGINREVRESEEAHAVMFEGLQATLAAAASAVQVQAEASITARFEPGLDQHVREKRAEA